MSMTVPLTDQTSPAEVNEFNYRPVPPLVPVSGAFALLSLTAFIWDVMIVVPVIGVVLALLAVRQIRRSAGMLSGAVAATAFAGMMGAAAVTAGAFHAYTFATELPPGYERVSFVYDIAEKGFVVNNGQPGIHPDVQKLDHQPVFLKGFMYPEKQLRGLTRFVLCKDSGQCCFGGQPKQTDMIQVVMAEGLMVNYRPGLIAVAGEFEIHPTLDESGLNPVYRLTGKLVSPAKTTY